jgi:hypothetical protein
MLSNFSLAGTHRRQSQQCKRMLTDQQYVTVQTSAAAAAAAADSD